MSRQHNTEELYRCASYLNNAGIRLLIHYHFEESFDAFRNAIQLMECVFCSVNEEKLVWNRRYDRALSSVKNFERILARLKHPEGTGLVPGLVVVSLANFLDFRVDELSASPLVCIDELESQESSDFDFISAITLMNFGSACILVHGVLPESESAVESALRLLKMSISVLDIKLELNCDRVLEIKEEYRSVAIAILSSMARIQRETRRLSDLEVSLMQLELLKLVTSDDTPPMLKNSAAAA